MAYFAALIAHAPSFREAIFVAASDLVTRHFCKTSKAHYISLLSDVYFIVFMKYFFNKVEICYHISQLFEP